MRVVTEENSGENSSRRMEKVHNEEFQGFSFLHIFVVLH